MQYDPCQCQCGRSGCASLRGRGLGARGGPGVRGGTKHGTTKRYDLGCRCEDCTKAKTDDGTARKKAQNAKTKPQAKNWRKQWTSAELEVALRDDLTAVEAAAILGRTYAGVMQARHRCKEPKYQRVLGTME